MCHLTVIGQESSGLDHWVLGENFMQAFYVVYDATETDKNGNELLRVGISAQGIIGTHILIIILGAIAAVMMALIGTLGVIIALRKRKKERTEAQIKFLQDKHRLENDDEDEEDLETDMNDASATLRQHAKRLSNSSDDADLADLDPNSLIDPNRARNNASIQEAEETAFPAL